MRDCVHVLSLPAATQLTTLEEQHAALFVKLPHMLRTAVGQHVRLVVLDSITALFRGGDDSAAAPPPRHSVDTSTTTRAFGSSGGSTRGGLSGTNLRARAASFFELSAHLRRLSEEHAIPIVVHITAVFNCASFALIYLSSLSDS